MPVVFIHGVSVREEQDSYLPSQKARDALFKEVTLEGLDQTIRKAKIRNPYWGGEAAKLWWDGDSLPRERGQAFGSTDRVVEGVAEEAVIQLGGAQNGLTQDNLLPRLARQHGLQRAVDLLWPSAELDTATGGSSDEQSEALARYSRDVLQYAQSNPVPAWLDEVGTNDEFAERLLNEVPPPADPGGDQAFGIPELWARVKAGAARVGNAAAAAVTNPVVRMVRPSLNEKISLFIGDVFVYFQSRARSGKNCPIVKKVSDALVSAMAERTATNQLMIVGHSMGGNVAYDLLTSFLKDDVHCDVLLTVGSQVPYFEELKLFGVSDPQIKKPDRVKRPANVERWINVYDRADVLSYTAAPVFEDIEDFEYSSGDTVLSAHGAYLLQPRFHQRLNRRLRRLP